MPHVSSVITSTTTGVAADTINALHSELSTVGLPVSGADVSGTPAFGTDTAARVRDFQQLYRLPPTGDLDPVTGGVLTLASLVATNPDPAGLRPSLQGAVGAVSGSQDYNDRLARVALMAGDYTLAAGLSPHLHDLSGVAGGVDLTSVVSTGSQPASPRQPEVPFPENFYSYRQSLMTDADIAALRSGATTPQAKSTLACITPQADDPQSQASAAGVAEPPPASGSGMSHADRLIASAQAFLNAIEAWQFGNSEYARQRYASAIDAYDCCQRAVLDYFSMFPDYNIQFATGVLAPNTAAGRVEELVFTLANNRASWSDVWAQVDWRRQLLSLDELGQFDWTPYNGGQYAHIAYQLLQGNLAGKDQPLATVVGPQHRKVFLDTRLIVIASVLVPLARGEANRMRRQYSEAIADFTGAQNPLVGGLVTVVNAPRACEFIEIPFARLLQIETMLDQAEGQYKARSSVDDETDQSQLARIGQIAQDFTTRGIPGDPTPGAAPLQHLAAAITYANALDAMDADGAYVARTKQGADDLVKSINSTVSGGDVTSLTFRALGTSLTVPTVTAAGVSVPGLTSGTYPHQPYLSFAPPSGQTVIPERNPRAYALLLQAQARLLQIWSGFNYLGYRDDYTPPWRFPVLLDRARYFAEHAKNAQRDYLNFLNNAEAEEYKELSASQNVELETANVAIETARVQQANDELSASQQSTTLAQLNATDAQQRLENYRGFDALMNVYDAMDVESGIVSSILTLNPGSMSSAISSVDKGEAQRELEKQNLELTAGEMAQAATVAAAQLQTAKAGLAVAGLQSQAALLRRESALQNLQFIRNQTLNTEQWYRLAASIRTVADTYLRYAIETAFLAQQAYNFEADKRLSVIRFDYDLSDVGAMLAADFLLADLDGLDQDLIVSQTTRLQQVRYVLSMAREFPETLRAIADTDTAMFSMRLEQLERRFPGMANLRLSSVDVQPVCLMDTTRLSLALTHLGTGMIRLQAQPGSSPLNTTDLAAGGDWLGSPGAGWPIKIHVSGPQTAVFSGLSRQDAQNLSAVTAGERGAFEGLAGASAWQFDMSMKDNAVVPNSLADVVITFTLAGYHDPALRTLVNQVSLRPMAATTWLSAQQTFPDAFYDFNQSARLQWPVTPDVLSLRSGMGAVLRNIGVAAIPDPGRPELGRLLCSYPVEFDVDAAAQLTVLPTLPHVTFTTSALTLTVAVDAPAQSTVSLDFGDGTGLVTGATTSHTYAAPGRYEVLVRIAAGGRLSEYRAAVVVSRQYSLAAPCVAIPVLTASTAAGGIKLVPTLQVPSGESLSVGWRLDGRGPDPGDPPSFVLSPGRHVLQFNAVRPITAHFYSSQRFDASTPVAFTGLNVATNRTFDPATGAETTGTTLNSFAQHVFGGAVLSPVDRWTLELPTDAGANTWLSSASSADTLRPDLGELSDLVLTMEYTGDGV